MEAMDKRKKGRLIKSIVFNIVVITACSAYIASFALPKYEEINLLTKEINKINTDFSSLKDDGVNSSSFTELLNRQGKKKDISTTIFADTEKLNSVLKKPATAAGDYLSWIVEENGKVSTIDKEIQANDRILGNIIPVFLNSSAAESDIDNQITLTSFISYVEKNILGKYALTSYTPLGISNISFPEKKDTPINIGNFKIELDFTGKNRDILAFIDKVQQSGKLTIRNGKLVSDDSVSSSEKGLSSLSNLLINIDSLALEDIPVVSSEQNKGKMSLEFYVEGMNYQKILILRSLLTAKFESLQKSIKEKQLLCAKLGNPLCNDTVTANAIVNIKGLMKNIVALQPKITAFKKGGIVIDVNKEMDILTEVKMSLQAIETVFLKNNSILVKAKK